MSLTNYIEKEQTKLFDKYGVIFAFSKKQFEENSKEDIDYVSLGIGMYIPKENAKDFIKEHEEVVDKGIKKDIEENGLEKIILRELCNYECFYTGDYTEAFEWLQDYEGITLELVRKVYNENRERMEI